MVPNPIKMDDLGGKNPYSWFDTQIHGVFFVSKMLINPDSLNWQTVNSCLWVVSLSTCRASERRSLYKVLLLVNLQILDHGVDGFRRTPPGLKVVVRFSNYTQQGIKWNHSGWGPEIDGSFHPFFTSSIFAVNIRISKGRWISEVTWTMEFWVRQT